MNELVAGERSVGVGEVVKGEDGAQAATCIAVGVSVAVVIGNAGVAADGTPVRPSKG